MNICVQTSQLNAVWVDLSPKILIICGVSEHPSSCSQKTLAKSYRMWQLWHFASQQFMMSSLHLSVKESRRNMYIKFNLVYHCHSVIWQKMLTIYPLFILEWLKKKPYYSLDMYERHCKIHFSPFLWSIWKLFPQYIRMFAWHSAKWRGLIVLFQWWTQRLWW